MVEPTPTDAPADLQGSVASPSGQEPAEGRRRSSNRRTLLVGLGMAVVTVATFAIFAAVSDGGPADSGVIPAQGAQTLGAVSGAEDSPLPDAVLDGFGGGDPVDVASYRGTPLVVNFWATWCPPCVKEMPDFQEVAEAVEGRVAFLGVNSQDREEAAVRFAEDLGVTYDMASDPAGDYFAAVNGYGWPTTLLVDPQGQVRYRHTGPLDAEQLTRLLADHLGVDV
jgi:cytochrome c biogenesis protein CcmG, thiol:disulfide interchange protein DsbE